MLRSLTIVLGLISLFIRTNIYGRYTECLDHQCCILQLSIVMAWMISKSRCGALIPIIYSDASLMDKNQFFQTFHLLFNLQLLRQGLQVALDDCLLG